MIDLSAVIGIFIVLLILILLRKVWPLVRAVLPPVVVLAIEWFADYVVAAVEADYAGEEGAEKRQIAFERINTLFAPIIEYMEKRGFAISADRIFEAIESSWYKMDFEQRATRLKEADAAADTGNKTE